MSKIFYLLIFLHLLLPSCGRKAPPQLKIFEKPEKVKDLKAIHNEKGIILSWSYEGKNQEIKGFVISRSEGGEYKKKGYIEGRKKNTFIDQDFRQGMAYRYRVIAEGIQGLLSDAAEISVTPANLPKPPENTRFHIKNDSIELSWDDNKGCYNIYRAYDGEEYQPINEKPVCGHTFIVRSIIEKTVHYIIKSLTITDIINEGQASERISIGPEDYIPSPPTELVIVVSDNKVFLLWKEPPERWVKGYRIYRRSEVEKVFRLIGESSIPGFADSNLNGLIGKKLYYMIKALGPSTESKPLYGDYLFSYPEIR